MRKFLLAVLLALTCFVANSFAQSGINNDIIDSYILMEVSPEKMAAQKAESINIPSTVKSQDELIQFLMKEYPLTDKPQLYLLEERNIIVVIKPVKD